LLIICFSIAVAYQQNKNGSQAVKLISGSSFKNSSLIIDGDYQTAAELSFPDEMNQFLILDMMREVEVERIMIHTDRNSQLSAGDIEVLIGQNVIGWTKVKSKNTGLDAAISVRLNKNSGRYIRINLGSKHHYQPIFINEVEVFIKEPIRQIIHDIEVPEEFISTSSAVIRYRTENQTDTYILYGNNFDFIYEGKISQVYSDLNMKREHQVRINELIPGTTYVFRIGIKDEQGSKRLSDYHYFSTKLMNNDQ